jgi:tetratricopeptide (TPR) repeat protein
MEVSAQEIINLLQAAQLEEAESRMQLAQNLHSTPEFGFMEMVLWAHQGKYAQANARAQELLKLDPQNPRIIFYLARLAIALGSWQEGLALFDSIRGAGPFGGPFLTRNKPLWSGEPPAGKTLFLASEGGLGDAVCFSRFTSELSQRGAKVILGGYEPVFPLLRTIPGVHALVDVSVIEKTDFDYWLPALSAPRLLGLELEQISGKPYIHCPSSSLEKWQSLTTSLKPKIALVWQGSESFAEDYLRSIPAEKFSKILSHDEFQFYSIRRLEDKNSFTHKNLCNVGEEIMDPQDLACFLANMDLVVSVDSAPAHLAGALGIPTVLLNREMGWFTFAAQPDKENLQNTPWYDSVRILHQKRWGQWDETLDRLEKLLPQLV